MRRAACRRRRATARPRRAIGAGPPASAGAGRASRGSGGVAGYSNTAEGKLVAAALLDAFNKLVVQVQAAAPNLPPVMPVAAAAPPVRTGADRALVASVQGELIRLGLLTGSADGWAGLKTRAAIGEYQRQQGLSA